MAFIISALSLIHSVTSLLSKVLTVQCVYTVNLWRGEKAQERIKMKITDSFISAGFTQLSFGWLHCPIFLIFNNLIYLFLIEG